MWKQRGNVKFIGKYMQKKKKESISREQMKVKTNEVNGKQMETKIEQSEREKKTQEVILVTKEEVQKLET